MQCFFRRYPDKLSDKRMQSLFSKLLQDHSFSLNQKNNFGNTPLDILEESRERLKSSGNFHADSVNGFMSSLVALSEAENAENKRLKICKDVFIKRNSIRRLSDEVAESKVIKAKFNDILYQTCVDIVSDDAAQYADVYAVNLARLDQILSDSILRGTLLNTDAEGNNFLQKLCLDIASQKVSSSSGEKLVELFSAVVSRLEKIDQSLLENLLFNTRNSKYENTVETVACVPGAHAVFRKLESVFGKHKLSDHCDFCSMLVNSAGAGDNILYEHLCSNYAIDRLSNTDLFGDSSLHKAVIAGSLVMVNSVLATGSDINKKNKKR
ncbi:MAG: hypothetical protein ACTJLM_05240 [Ehrlichia sp.]